MRGRDVIGFDQDDFGVTVELSDAGSLHAQYLVGCDCGRSFVRKHAGIGAAVLQNTMAQTALIGGDARR